MPTGGGGQSYDASALGRTLGNKLESFATSPAPTFGKSLYTGMGGVTESTLGSMLGNADPAGYSGFAKGAIGRFGNMAAGNEIGTEAPGYQAVRANLKDDVMTDVNSLFASSGRFGSGSHVDTLTDSLTSSLGALDLGEYHRGEDQAAMAAGMLPNLYAGASLPDQTRLAVGQMGAADNMAERQAEAELFDRTTNADYNRFLQMLQAFTGSSQAPGMGEKPDFFQTLLGGLGMGAGLLLR